MSELVRAFFAVELSGAARAQAEAASEALSEVAQGKVRWATPENMHLTLKFLGSIEPTSIAKLVRGAASRLARADGFDVELGGIGAFPNARKANVVWLGVTRGATELSRLARKLDSAASKVGVEREHRPYRPHLTLGRLRPPAPLPIERVATPAGEPFRVREVVLFESRLAVQGARDAARRAGSAALPRDDPRGPAATYVPLARLPLALAEEEADAFQTEFAPEI